MKKPFKKADMSTLAPLLIFTIFTICILIVLLSGADIYQKFTERDQTSYSRRTAAQYLTTRVRQSDADGMYYVGDFDEQATQAEGDTYFIREVYGEEEFVTRIYCHDGYLYELYTFAGVDFSPQDGEKILELNDLHFTLQDDLLRIEIEYADSTSETLILHLRSQEEQP